MDLDEVKRQLTASYERINNMKHVFAKLESCRGHLRSRHENINAEIKSMTKCVVEKLLHLQRCMETTVSCAIAERESQLDIRKKAMHDGYAVLVQVCVDADKLLRGRNDDLLGRSCQRLFSRFEAAKCKLNALEKIDIENLTAFEFQSNAEQFLSSTFIATLQYFNKTQKEKDEFWVEIPASKTRIKSVDRDGDCSVVTAVNSVNCCNNNQSEPQESVESCTSGIRRQPVGATRVDSKDQSYQHKQGLRRKYRSVGLPTTEIVHILEVDLCNDENSNFSSNIVHPHLDFPSLKLNASGQRNSQADEFASSVSKDSHGSAKFSLVDKDSGSSRQCRFEEDFVWDSDDSADIPNFAMSTERAFKSVSKSNHNEVPFPTKYSIACDRNEVTANPGIQDWCVLKHDRPKFPDHLECAVETRTPTSKLTKAEDFPQSCKSETLIEGMSEDLQCFPRSVVSKKSCPKTFEQFFYSENPNKSPSSKSLTTPETDLQQPAYVCQERGKNEDKSVENKCEVQQNEASSLTTINFQKEHFQQDFQQAKLFEMKSKNVERGMQKEEMIDIKKEHLEQVFQQRKMLNIKKDNVEPDFQQEDRVKDENFEQEFQKRKMLNMKTENFGQDFQQKGTLSSKKSEVSTAEVEAVQKKPKSKCSAIPKSIEVPRSVKSRSRRIDLSTMLEYLGNSLFEISAKCIEKIYGDFDHPIGICTNRKGDVIVTDTCNNIIKVYSNGRIVSKFGANLKMRRPSAVVVNEKDEIFVKDNICIYHFNAEGDFIKSMGRRMMNTPYGLGLSNKGELVVIDALYSNARIHTFRQNGALDTHPYMPLRNRLENSKCRFLAVHGEEVLTSDLGRNCLYLTNLQGQLKKTLGKSGRGYGELNEPAGVAVDSAGNWIVADSRNNRIQLFASNGYFMAMLKFHGESICRPAGIHLTNDGLLYIINYLDSVIKVFKLGA